jgi:hypothetical protein
MKGFRDIPTVEAETKLNAQKLTKLFYWKRLKLTNNQLVAKNREELMSK